MTKANRGAKVEKLLPYIVLSDEMGVSGICDPDSGQWQYTKDDAYADLEQAAQRAAKLSRSGEDYAVLDEDYETVVIARKGVLYRREEG